MRKLILAFLFLFVFTNFAHALDYHQKAKAYVVVWSYKTIQNIVKGNIPGRFSYSKVYDFVCRKANFCTRSVSALLNEKKDYKVAINYTWSDLIKRLGQIQKNKLYIPLISFSIFTENIQKNNELFEVWHPVFLHNNVWPFVSFIKYPKVFTLTQNQVIDATLMLFHSNLIKMPKFSKNTAVLLFLCLVDPTLKDTNSCLFLKDTPEIKFYLQTLTSLYNKYKNMVSTEQVRIFMSLLKYTLTLSEDISNCKMDAFVAPNHVAYMSVTCPSFKINLGGRNPRKVVGVESSLLQVSINRALTLLKHNKGLRIPNTVNYTPLFFKYVLNNYLLPMTALNNGQYPKTAKGWAILYAGVGYLLTNMVEDGNYTLLQALLEDFYKHTFSK